MLVSSRLSVGQLCSGDDQNVSPDLCREWSAVGVVSRQLSPSCAASGDGGGGTPAPPAPHSDLSSQLQPAPPANLRLQHRQGRAPRLDA